MTINRSSRASHAPTLVLVIAFLVAPFLAVAFGQGEVREFTMWFGRQDFIPDDNFETFHAENPDIRVTTDVIPLEQGLTEYIPAFQFDRAPDILQLNHFNILPLVQQGMLADIGEVLERWRSEDPDDFADIAPVAFDLATVDGVTYGMSMWAGPRFHVYRTDLFEAAGLSTPETWDDVLEAARVLRAPDMLGISLHGSRAHSPLGWFGSMFMNMGGEFVDGVMQIDSDAGVYLLEFYQAVLRDGLVDPDVLSLNSGDFRAEFLTGRAAQFYEAANLYPRLNENLEYGTQWAAIPPPVRPGGEADATIPGFGWPFLVNANVDDMDAIYKILRYVSTYSGQVAIRYQPPTRLSVFQDPVFLAAQPWWSEIAGVFDEMIVFPNHPRITEMEEIILDAKQWALMNPTGDAAAAAREFQAQLDAVHAR